MKTVILRPSAIYGPGDPERFVMIYRRARTGKFTMFGDGRTYYHPLYIDNLVDSFLLVMQDGVGDGQAYLIADEEYLEISTEEQTSELQSLMRISYAVCCLQKQI